MFAKTLWPKGPVIPVNNPMHAFNCVILDVKQHCDKFFNELSVMGACELGPQ